MGSYHLAWACHAREKWQDWALAMKSRAWSDQGKGRCCSHLSMQRHHCHLGHRHRRHFDRHLRICFDLCLPPGRPTRWYPTERAKAQRSGGEGSAGEQTSVDARRCGRWEGSWWRWEIKTAFADGVEGRDGDKRGLLYPLEMHVPLGVQ